MPEYVTRSAERGRFSSLQVAGFVSAILLLAVIVVLVFTSLSASKVEWLTPAELARRTQPGPFTAFKQKVRNLTAPVRRRFQRAPSQITINSTLLTCSSRPHLLTRQAIGFIAKTSRRRGRSSGTSNARRENPCPGSIGRRRGVRNRLWSRGSFFQCESMDIAKPSCWPFAPAGRACGAWNEAALFRSTRPTPAHPCAVLT